MRNKTLSIALLLLVSSSSAQAFWFLLRAAQAAELAKTDPLVPNTFPFTFLSALGFTQADQLVVILCPMFAMLGSLVRISLRLRRWSEARVRSQRVNADTRRVWLSFARHGAFLLATMFVAFVAGLLVALYFAGAITPTREAIGKLLAFSLMIGFIAPTFFLVQERRILNLYRPNPPHSEA